MEDTKWSNLFNNKDLYPTPIEVIQMMGLNVSGEVILEPHGGKGDIIDYCKEHGAKDILFCEINEDLATISRTKAKMLKPDFLNVTAEEVSHITQIIANPPFSTSKKHLQHAWDIAPDGCEITFLFNSDTLDSLRWDGRELNRIIQDYGNTIYLGEVFKQAERKTNVKVALIKLYKPNYSNNESFEGFYMDAEPETAGVDGIMKYNEVQALVNGYIGALKCFDEFELINKKMKSCCKMVGMDRGFRYEVGYDKNVVTKQEFAKELQKQSWKHIFAQMNLSKYLTRGVMQDINNFVEKQTNVPFTVKNIYRMFEIVIGTKDQNFDKALVEAVDYFTKHTKENRFGVEGWVTNAGHMINKKFISDWVFESKWGSSTKVKTRYGSQLERLDDLTKVLCNLTGFDYEKTTPIERFVSNFDGIETNRWYVNGFFEFKGFKKGTIHIKFTDDKVWEQLNRRYAKIVGMVLPTNFGKKDYEPEEFKTKQDTKTTERKSEPLSNEIKDKIRATILQQQSKQVLTDLFS